MPWQLWATLYTNVCLSENKMFPESLDYGLVCDFLENIFYTHPQHWNQNLSLRNSPQSDEGGLLPYLHYTTILLLLSVILFLSLLMEALCTSTGPGTATCQCNTGWTGDGKDCMAIDNCMLESRGNCHFYADCIYIGPGQVWSMLTSLMVDLTFSKLCSVCRVLALRWPWVARGRKWAGQQQILLVCCQKHQLQLKPHSVLASGEMHWCVWDCCSTLKFICSKGKRLHSVICLGISISCCIPCSQITTLSLGDAKLYRKAWCAAVEIVHGVGWARSRASGDRREGAEERWLLRVLLLKVLLPTEQGKHWTTCWEKVPNLYQILVRWDVQVLS